MPWLGETQRIPSLSPHGHCVVSQLEHLPSCYNCLCTWFCTAPSRLCRLCSAYKVESIPCLSLYIQEKREKDRSKGRKEGGREKKITHSWTIHSFTDSFFHSSQRPRFRMILRGVKRQAVVLKTKKIK